MSDYGPPNLNDHVISYPDQCQRFTLLMIFLSITDDEINAFLLAHPQSTDEVDYDYYSVYV